MGRLIRSLLGCVILAAPLACDGGAAQDSETFSPDPTRNHRVAWIGVCADGSPLVVEPLAPAHHPELAKVKEENVLREIFRLDESTTILRVHVCGATAGRLAGKVQTPGGDLLQALGDPPEDLPDRDRLMWEAVARGGGEAWTETRRGERRTYLIAGEGLERSLHDSMEWIQGDHRATLERHSWTERERREFLDAAYALPEPEHPTVTNTDD